VRLLLELFLSVGEGTIITELALLTVEPKFAELGPLLQVGQVKLSIVVEAIFAVR
jgi:hypothetical protein